LKERPLRLAGVTLLAAALPLLARSAELAPPAYHVAARYEIGGTDIGYDFLRIDSASRRLFVAHRTRVDVLDADTGARLGEIANLAGVHGVEVVHDLNVAFATNGANRTVTMFNPGTLELIKTIKYAGEKPDALAYDPSSALVFVANGGATGDLTVIDPAKGAIVGTVDLGAGKLEVLAFDGQGRGFVNDEDRSVVHVFDTHTLKPVAKWPLAPGEEPTGLAIDRAHHRLFAACGNERLVVLDTDTGKVVDTVAIGASPDGAAFQAQTGHVFVSNGDGTMTVIGKSSAGRYAVLQTVKTATGARTIDLDESTGRLFLPAGRFGPAPAPTAAVPEPHAPLIPASFAVIVVAP